MSAGCVGCQPSRSCVKALLCQGAGRRVVNRKKRREPAKKLGGLSGDALLQRQPEKKRRIQSVHRRPAVPAVANIRRNPCFARDAEKTRREAGAVAEAMH